MASEGTFRVRLTLSVAFLLMGFSFSVSQSLLVREMLVSFAGNELSIGAVLGSWLLLEAAGSALLGRLLARLRHARLGYAGLQVIFALLLVPVLDVAFGVRHLMGGIPGQGFGLLFILSASFLLLIPLGLVDGAMFTLGCRVSDTFRRGGSGGVGGVYVREAIGGIVGGLVFTYLLVAYLHSVQVALIVVALNLASALSLVLLPQPVAGVGAESGAWLGSAALGIVLLLVLCLGVLLTPWAGRIHGLMAAWQWRGYDLAFYGNSVYGNVSAVRQGGQYTFFSNGVPILTSPVPNTVLVEEMVHLPLLFVAQPRRALVLSGGLGGVLRELLKYPLEQVDYAELDALLINAVASLPTALTQAELNDPRLHIERVDGRLMVRRLAASSGRLGGEPLLPNLGETWRRAWGGQYDLIVINLPYPTTLQLNRFYTAEFWNLVRGLLADDGVVVFPAPGSLAYLSPGMRDLHGCLHATLGEVFPHLRPIPGDVTLWLASPSGMLSSARIDELTARWEARGVAHDVVTSFHIRLKLDERRLAWFWGSLRDGPSVPANEDLRPSGLLCGLTYWNELFSPGLTPYFRLLGRLSLPGLAVPVIVVVLVGVVGAGLRRPRRARCVPIAILATGFGGMTANLLIIFAFQAFYGYVYQLIGLLTTAFMAGLSLGGWVMARKGPGRADTVGLRRDGHRLVSLEVGMVVFWLMLPVVLTALHGQMTRGESSALVGPALLLLNALAGCLVGAQFPVANRMYAATRGEASGRAGLLYAADLVGGCAAALFVSAALVPALGVVQTCLLVAVLKGGSLLLVMSVRENP